MSRHAGVFCNMICGVRRTGGGVLSPRFLTGAVLIASLWALNGGDAAAKAYDEDACAALDAEMQLLISDGIDKTVEKGPEWGRANLSTPELERVKRFLTVEEQIVFRCTVVDSKPKSQVAKKKGSKKRGVIPLPVPKPGRETTVVTAAELGPANLKATATHNLGAIVPSTARTVVALPHLTAAVAPLPGLRSVLEPAELAEKPEKPETSKKTEEGSAVASLEDPLPATAPKPDPEIAPEAKGPEIPLPVRNPIPHAVRKRAARPAPAVRRPATVRRTQPKKPPEDSLPSAADVFTTN